MDEALLLGPGTGANRRTSERYDASLPIAIQAVNESLVPVGELHEAVTADLSQGGVRFFNSKPIVSRLAVVSLTTADDQPLQLLAQVIRCKRNGVLFEIAVTFLRKLSPTTSDAT